VLELEPNNTLAYIYLMWALAEDGGDKNYEAMEALEAAFPDHQAFWPAIQMIKGHRLGDSASMAAGLDSLYRLPAGEAIVMPWLYASGTLHGTVPDLDLLSRQYRNWTDSTWMASFWGSPGKYIRARIAGNRRFASVEMARGRLRSARAALEAMDLLPASIAPPELAYQATLPLPVDSPVDTVGLADRIRDWSIPELSDSANTFNPLTKTQKENEHLIRPLALGFLAAKAGDYGAARAYADEIESLRTDPGFPYPSVPTDVAQGLRAEILFREGRPAETIAAIDAAERNLNYNEPALVPILSVGRVNYLRALALQQLGEHEEALRWFTHGVQLTELAPSHLHRGEIHEELGNIDQAIWHYEAFAELWKDSDPEFRPKVREVLQHVAELRGEVVDVTAN